jgi:hypothetical protein
LAAAEKVMPITRISMIVPASPLNRDGGFGGALGQRSSQMQTGWAALGLAATGHNPLDVSRAGRSVVDYARAHAGALRGDLGERTRTVLVLRAAGVSARSFAGRDLGRPPQTLDYLIFKAAVKASAGVVQF